MAKIGETGEYWEGMRLVVWSFFWGEYVLVVKCLHLIKWMLLSVYEGCRVVAVLEASARRWLPGEWGAQECVCAGREQAPLTGGERMR